MRPLEQMPRSSDEQQAENSAMHGEPEAEKMPTSARTLGDQFGIHRHSPGDLHAQERLKGFHLGRGTRYLLQKLSYRIRPRDKLRADDRIQVGYRLLTDGQLVTWRFARSHWRGGRSRVFVRMPVCGPLGKCPK